MTQPLTYDEIKKESMLRAKESGQICTQALVDMVHEERKFCMVAYDGCHAAALEEHGFKAVSQEEFRKADCSKGP